MPRKSINQRRDTQLRRFTPTINAVRKTKPDNRRKVRIKVKPSPKRKAYKIPRTPRVSGRYWR